MQKKITSGRYKHYKGQQYDVECVACHEETLEYLVIYRSVENPELVFARPIEVFQECVHWDGKILPRFQYVGSC